MELNARNGPKMTEEQITAYLARIGISSPVPLTLEGLGKLQMAHRLTVPFENLDIVAGRPLSLELPHLYDKIVRRRQGGVCAELNTLYNWLLYSLGFQVTSYNARMLSPDTYLFRRHRILAVRLAGGTYTTDVGFATENARVPLLLAEGVVQRDGHCTYRYQQEEFYGWVQCQRRPGHDWERIQAFTLEPQIDRDFDPVLFFFEKSPASNMNQFPRPSLYTPEGMLALRQACFSGGASGAGGTGHPHHAGGGATADSGGISSGPGGDLRGCPGGGEVSPGEQVLVPEKGLGGKGVVGEGFGFPHGLEGLLRCGEEAGPIGPELLHLAQYRPVPGEDGLIPVQQTVMERLQLCLGEGRPALQLAAQSGVADQTTACHEAVNRGETGGLSPNSPGERTGPRCSTTAGGCVPRRR